jgi:hypothetical protein
LGSYAAQGDPHGESAFKNAASLFELLDAVESGHGVNVSQGKLSEQLEQTQADISRTIEAIGDALVVYRKALEDGIDKYLAGRPVKPVFSPECAPQRVCAEVEPRQSMM